MPGTLQLVQVTKTPQKIQTFLVSNDSFMLVNPDITNNIFIGNDPGSQLIAVPALGSVTLNASKHDIWVSTNGGNFTVNAYLMPNGSNWVPSPAQVAAQINALGLAKDTTVNSVVTNTTGVAKDTTVGTVAANTTGVAKDTSVNAVNTTLGTPAQDGTVTGVNNSLVFGTTPAIQNLTIGGNPGGVPLLRDTINLANATSQNAPANAATTLLSNVNVALPSFEAIFTLWFPASSGTIPFAVITMTWSDSFTGQQVGRKAYVAAFGNGSANAITVYITGPVRGNQLTLTLSNRDPSIAGSFTYAFNLTSHLYLVDRLLQPLYPPTPPNGQTQGAGNPSKGLLFASKPTVGGGAGTTVTRQTAASNAKCKLHFDLGGAPNALNITLATPSITTLYDEAVSPQVLYRVNGVTGNGVLSEIQMPNGPVDVNMINQGASAVSPSVVILADEY